MGRQFHVGDVLSVMTGKLVSPRLIGGVYDILNYMLDDHLFTHQLPRASRKCAPYLLKQHPQLAAVDVSTVNPETWRAWLVQQVATFGETLTVEPVPAAEREYVDPIAEAEAMVGPERVIVVRP